MNLSAPRVDGDVDWLAMRTALWPEASKRVDYVNGTGTSPVIFVEGLYVVPNFRRLRVARRLVNSVITWAREEGCRELASDSLLDKIDAHAAHRALGFEETERVVYFRMTIPRL